MSNNEDCTKHHDGHTPAESLALAMGMSLPKPKPKARKPKNAKVAATIYDIIHEHHSPAAESEHKETNGTLNEAKASLRELRDRWDVFFENEPGEAELSADEMVLRCWTQGRAELKESFNIVEREIEVTV